MIRRCLRINSVFDYRSYPALYRAADRVAVKSQQLYLWIIRGYLILMIAGTVAAAYVSHLETLRIVASGAFLLVLVLTAVMSWGSGPKKWYYARALAESVKTMTWKFMMSSDPYGGSDAHEEFIRDIRQLLKQNTVIGELLPSGACKVEVLTDTMLDTRNRAYEERLEFYLRHRVQDQLDWYETKTKQNSRSGGRWFGILMLLLLFALFSLVGGTQSDVLSKFPIEIAASGATSLLTWIQVKRFQDLSAAYNLATHEIAAIKGLARFVDSEDKFNRFVNDAENAFSREHTQWVARRGH